jgi:hypothetical protein
MKKLIALLALAGVVTLGAPGIALAQDKGAPATTTTPRPRTRATSPGC